jgi:predicted dehydrogenase
MNQSAVTIPLRIGIVGAHPHRGWALDAHVPALRKLPQFALTAVSARTRALAEEARAVFGAARAYGDSLELVRAPDVDVVAITVKVPEHRTVVLAALAAGKHVYCEWPLGRDPREADELAAAVGPHQHAAVGLQGLSAPAIRHAVEQVHSGVLGRLRVMRAFSPTVAWGAEALPHYAYLQDKRNGATLETIAGGHTLAALEALAGPYVEVDARNSTLLKSVRVSGTNEIIERTCADHMLVLGKHESGCVSTLEVIGNTSSRPFILELSGERGSLKVSGGRGGGYQVGGLKFEASVETGTTPNPVVPELGLGPPSHLAEAYARFAADIRSGVHSVPDFRLAARLTHLLDRIDAASSSGIRQSLDRRS